MIISNRPHARGQFQPAVDTPGLFDVDGRIYELVFCPAVPGGLQVDALVSQPRAQEDRATRDLVE
jgi:hypothetical protein